MTGATDNVLVVVPVFHNTLVAFVVAVIKATLPEQIVKLGVKLNVGVLTKTETVELLAQLPPLLPTIV